MTDPAALYRCYDSVGALLYVGVSGDVKIRASCHKSASPWFCAVRKITVTWYDWREDALDAEAWAIFREKPQFNKKIALKRIAETSRVSVVMVVRGSSGQKAVAQWMDQSGVTVKRLARRMSVWEHYAHMRVFDPMERHMKAMSSITGLDLTAEELWS